MGRYGLSITSQQKLITKELVQASESEVVKAMIWKQLEFYFSDWNLVTDKHIRSLFNNKFEQAVKISELLKFNRIQDFFSPEVSVLDRTLRIIEAVSESKKIKTTKDKTSIKRKKRFSLKEALKFVRECTLYIQFQADLQTKFNVISELSKLNFNVKKCKELKDSIGQFKNWFEIVFKSSNDVQSFLGEAEELKINSNSIFFNWLCFSVEEWKKYQTESVKYKRMALEFESITLDNDNSTENEFNRDCILIIRELPDEITKIRLKETISIIQKPKYIDFNTEDPDWKLRF